jgi:hypothetical protein
VSISPQLRRTGSALSSGRASSYPSAEAEPEASKEVIEMRHDVVVLLLTILLVISLRA